MNASEILTGAGAFLALSLVFTLLFGVVSFSRVWSRPLRRLAGLHAWSYRNPYDRTCDGCGRNQVMYSQHWTDKHGWWETFKEGNGYRFSCGSKPNTKGSKA